MTDIRTKILDAALQVFAETGYRGATTRRIAQEADVNEVTLFRHFGSKEELIRAAVHHAAGTGEAWLPAVPERPYEELVRWARDHYRRLCQRAPMIRACLGESNEHPEMMERVSHGPMRVGAELRRYLSQLCGQEEKNGASEVDVAAGMLMSMLFTDAIGRGAMPLLFPIAVQEAPARYAEFVLHALGVMAESPEGSKKQNPKADGKNQNPED
jgi:AcrR family transcriptional regulator